LAAFAFAGDEPNADVVFTDDKGQRWTDLHVVTIHDSVSQYNALDFQTLKNAKLTCLAKGAQLPEVSHLNDLAESLGRKYLLSLEAGNPETIDARFMKYWSFFWTATVTKEDDRFVFNRAISRLSQLSKSNDMSKAETTYRPATDDNKKRPFLCVYMVPST